MATTLDEKNATMTPADWWAAPAVQASRLAAAASFYPVLAAWEVFRLTCTTVAGFSAPPFARKAGYREHLAPLFDPPEEGPAQAPRAPSPIPGMTRADLEEIKYALEEYEEARGDWSKSR